MQHVVALAVAIILVTLLAFNALTDHLDAIEHEMRMERLTWRQR